MECPNCKANNEGAKRFCTVCGAALGALCKRCGKMGKAEDKFCGDCGTALLASSNEHLFSHPGEASVVKCCFRESSRNCWHFRKSALNCVKLL